MSFQLHFISASKHDAIAQLESADGLPPAVRSFVSQAIDGFLEEGGNHPTVSGDDPGLAEIKKQNGLAKNPVKIKVDVDGHLDLKGGASSLSIAVTKG